MKVLTRDEAVRLINSGDTVLIGGSGGGHAVPEALLCALEQRFLESGAPRQLTSLHPVGLGDEATRGANHLAHRGLLKRIVCGTYVDSPAIAQLALRNEVEAYTLPQGAISQLMREIAAGRPGLITHVGLETFIDPRYGGGRQSETAVDDLVELITIDGREWLRYKPMHIDVALLRGTTADEDGNITMEREPIFGEMLSMAQAARRCGAPVIVQVSRIAAAGTLNPRMVKIPGCLVDYVVVEPDEWQTYETKYDPAYAGELRVPLSSLTPLELSPRKVIARRGAMELYPGAVCNLGSGISTLISAIAAEENIVDRITLTNEQGLIGGMPASGNDAGASRNFGAMVDQPYQFDFYDGGGLDLAFLSFAEVDAAGNVNISRFGGRIVGVGGFVNISQNAKKVVFGGTFRAGRSDIRIAEGGLRIAREGAHAKFVQRVQQLSYSAGLGRRRGQEVLYVTERAVFRFGEDCLEVIEVAPGIDPERDITAQLDFRTVIASDVRLMDERLFRPEPMGLDVDLDSRPVVRRRGGESRERLAVPA